TVDDLNLQIRAKQDYFPVFGRGLARLLGEKPNNISISRLYIKNSEGDEVPEIKLTVLDERNYKLDVGDLVLKG
ncbi:tyrosine-protein kinase, partial [Escherichia coli]